MNEEELRRLVMIAQDFIEIERNYHKVKNEELCETALRVIQLPMYFDSFNLEKDILEKVISIAMEREFGNIEKEATEVKAIEFSKLILNTHEGHEEYVFCPFCGAKKGTVRVNGKGYYRCRDPNCKEEFVLLRYTEESIHNMKVEGENEDVK